jgi:hypothetical protein
MGIVALRRRSFRSILEFSEWLQPLALQRFLHLLGSVMMLGCEYNVWALI